MSESLKSSIKDRAETNPIIYGYSLEQWREGLGCEPTPYLIERECYKELVRVEVAASKMEEYTTSYKGGKRKSWHFKRAMFAYQGMTLGKQWDPVKSWYPGAERMLRLFCGEHPDDPDADVKFDKGMVPACSHAMKTYWICRFIGLHFIFFPAETIVYFATINEARLKRGLWADIVFFIEQCPEVASQYKILTSSQNRSITWLNPHNLPCSVPLEKCAVYGLCIKKGDTQAVTKISGVRNLHTIVFVDEGDEAEASLYTTATTNLRNGTDFFRLISAGNPLSEMSEFQRQCEPVGGYGDEPPAERSYMSKTGAMVVQINSLLDNPNITCNPDLAVDMPLICPHLQKRSDLREIIKDAGINSAKWFQMVVGWWAPSNFQRRLIPRAYINQGLDREPFVFLPGAIHIGAGIDLAYDGGDRCVYQPFKIGDINMNVARDGQEHTIKVAGINLLTPRIIKIDVLSKVPTAFQIANQVKSWNAELNVDPRYCGFDSTAADGMEGIFYQDISTLCVPVDHNGKPSERRFRASDTKLPGDIVDRRVTELWDAVGVWLSEGQLRGLSADAAQELGSRGYDIVGGGKRKADTKRQMKKDYGYSPDAGDAVAVVVEVCRFNGYQACGIMTGGAVDIKSREPDLWAMHVRHLQETTYSKRY